MMRWFRRLLWLGVLAGGGYAGYKVLGRGNSAASSPATAPEWLPLPTKPTPAQPVAAESETSAPSTESWVAPIDGECPSGYPLKANDNSGIFHVPGGRFYARTVAERCYANAEDAIADGYRQAKA
ncbi:MAG: hypothetical protein ABI949_10335 [Ilumatobacteraceae bacterium]